MVRLLIALRARWFGALAEGDRRAGRYDAADRLVRKAIDCVEGAGHLETNLGIRLLNSLGIVCKYRCRFPEGTSAYLRALRIARRRLHPRDLTFATLYHNVGGILHAQGRHRRAEVFARRALEIRELALGPAHIDTARDAAALAGILDGLGRHREAERLHLRALEIFHGRGRTGRLEVAFTRANLAACLHFQRRFGEAALLAAGALTLHERLLGAAHPETRSARINFDVIRQAREAQA